MQGQVPRRARPANLPLDRQEYHGREGAGSLHLPGPAEQPVRRLRRNLRELSMDDDVSFDGIIARREMRQRQAEIGRRALAIVDVALRELEQKIARGEPLNMTCADALKLRD